MDPVSQEKQLKKSRRVVGLSTLGFFFLPLFAHAASLYISPAQKNVTVGQIFTVSGYVSSPDKAMNAASGDISFPSSKLEVISVSKANSVMDLWIRDPSFTNSAAGGDVHFEGVVLNPGFTGNAGNLITITFQAIGIGDAPITYSSGAVLANDGNGTNILNGLEPGDVTVGPRVAPPATVSTSSSGPITTSTATSTAPAGPVTTSTESSSGTIPQFVLPQGEFKNALLGIGQWGLIALLVLLLLGAIIFLALEIVHRTKKWRAASHRDLLTLEEMLRKDIKKIERDLGKEKLAKQDPVRKTLEHIEADIKKDIDEIDNTKEK